MAATSSAFAPEALGRRPLTEGQQGMWFAQRIDAANPTFNTGQYIALKGPLDVDAFRAALAQACAESETLAVRVAGETEQEIDPANLPQLEIVDLRAAPDPHAAAVAAARADMARPCDPTREPLACQRLFVVADDHHLWYQRIHHIGIDGVGTMLICARVADLYSAAVTRRAAGPALTPFAKVLEEDADYRASPKYEQARAYWTQELADAGEAASLAPAPAPAGDRVNRLARDLAGATIDALAAGSERAGLPWPDVATALIGAYCARHIGGTEVILGVPHMGRFGSKAARAPSMVMNVLPLRLSVDEDAPLQAFLDAAVKRMLRGRRHGRYRGEQMRRDLGLVGGHRRLHGPLVNILPFDEAPAFAGLSSDIVILGTGPVDDLTISLRGDPGTRRLRLEIEANPALYDGATLDAHAERLETFLARAATAERLADVPTVTDAEDRWFDGLNATDHPVEDTTLAALIERQLQATPSAQAIVFEGESVSYAELEERTAALAERLIERGAGPQTIVVVALPRSVDLIVALIAVLRTGAAYLPLDRTHPPERLRRILASARPVAILAEDGRGFAGPTPVLAPRSWPLSPARPLASPAQPDDPAYVIYTSGSTGEPKGVVVEHRAIVNRLEWMRTHYGFGPGDRILQKTPMTFDVSVWEFFLPYLSGATLVVAPPEAHKDPVRLVEIIRREAITTLHFVPSMLGAFLAEPQAKGLSVRRVFCSGEELTADLRDRFHRTMNGELHNLYGPTEAAVDVSYWPAGADDSARPVPIGWPVWNTSLHVLDARLRPVPPGVVGDLYLGGRQLARGYLGRPDLTSERFIPDPRRPGERLYRTGDVARRRADGAVVFLGRIDHQVKIRGLRIELDEIEAAVVSSPMVRQAGIIARDVDGLGARILAYVVPGDDYEEATLAAHVAAKVPDYMVPSVFIELEALPVTGNGKLDRAALPVPAFAAAAGRAPDTATEKTVARLFAQVLRSDAELSAEDDFFALGGHSLLAVELMRRIRDAFGRDPGLGTLFAHSTVARLAERIDRPDETVSGLDPLIRLTEGDGAPVFVIHPAGGISWCYGGLARALGRPVWAIQARALDPDAPEPESLEAVAEDYADLILQAGTPAPVHVAGWSVGGILAQAVAVALQRRGVAVGVVAMLDSYPCDCWRDEPDPGPGAELKALLAIAGHDPDRLHDLDLTRPSVMAFLKQSDSPLAGLPDDVLDGIMRVVAANNRLVRGHRHDRLDGVLLHFRAALDHAESGLTPDSWRPYAAALDVVEISSLHGDLTGAEATAAIAPVLLDRLARAEDQFQDHPHA